MELILQWGLDLIRVVQTIANVQLTFFFRIITSFGGAAVYLLLLPFFFWCVNEKKGFQFGLTVLISVWINLVLKFLLDQPRPFFAGYDPSLGMIQESMGGLPSGHAQNSLVIYFILASWLKKKWGYICAGIFCLLIGFSRIYLGVHFPTDVLAGWFLGGIILCVYFFLGGKIETLLERNSFRAKVITIALVSFIMILYIPHKNLLMPGGTFLGFGIGYCLNKRYLGFKSRDVLIKPGMYLYFSLFIRMVLGTAGFVLIFFVTGRIIPHESALISGNNNLFGFLQSALGGLWISFAAPWLFVRFNLAAARLD